MRFPAIEQLGLPGVFERLVPGQLHVDGHRYLPLIVLRLHESAWLPGGQSPLLSVVDRHHVVATEYEGRAGVARLVFLLSMVQLQDGTRHQGLVAEEHLAEGRPSGVPLAYGRVLAVPAWEMERQHLPYESLYTELVLDIGVGVIGVRTSTTAADLEKSIGKRQIEPGDWIVVRRSRIDILGFKRSE